MLDDWVEIFKAGTHTAKNGYTGTWTEADIDEMVSSFDPKDREVPIVIGHPKDDGPAYGWVDKLKRSGSTLLAKFKQVDQGFIDLLKAGRFKNRSISLFKNSPNRLRHVGFLGAAQPAVAGLKGIGLCHADAGYEFSMEVDQAFDPLDFADAYHGKNCDFEPNLTYFV